MKKSALLVMFVFGLAACASAPPVGASRQALWNQFGGQPLDHLLLTWGPPMAETHLTNGARMVSYTFSEYYDIGSYDESAMSCKASFLAPPSDFKIASITLDGGENECAELAKGHLGVTGYLAPDSSIFGLHHPF